jgi:hypothetical protein
MTKPKKSDKRTSKERLDFIRSISPVIIALLCFLFIGGSSSVGAGGGLVYKDRKAPIEKRIADLIGRLTLEEKISMIHGDKEPGNYVRDVVSSVPRPAHELKGIRKISLAPGESRKVTFKLDRGAFSFSIRKRTGGKPNRGNSLSRSAALQEIFE